MKLIAACIALLLPATSFGQDQCRELLRHGIYNTVRSEQAGSSGTTIYNQICSSYNSSHAGTLKADASGNFSVISGAASFSKTELESIGQAMCSSSYSDAQAMNEVSNFSAVVSPEGLKAFNECVKDANAGLIVNTKYDENAPEFVILTAHYSPIGNAPGKNYIHAAQIQSSSPNANLNIGRQMTPFPYFITLVVLVAGVLAYLGWKDWLGNRAQKQARWRSSLTLAAVVLLATTLLIVGYVGHSTVVGGFPRGDVSCFGTLYDAAMNNAPITSAELSMTCRRPIQNDPSSAFNIAGRSGGIAYPASITVPTDVGDISFLYGAMFLPPLPSAIPPAFVGEIRAIAFQSDDPAFTTLSENGWMECKGQALSTADYPDLYKALGNRWGTTNLGATFKIPDLRGEFLRGWDHGAPIDLEAAGRGVADPGNPRGEWAGSSGDSVASRQLSALQSHTHSIADFNLGQSGGGGGKGVLENFPAQSRSTSGPTGNVSPYETRPLNVAVMYVIYTGKRPSH